MIGWDWQGPENPCVKHMKESDELLGKFPEGYAAFEIS